MPARSSADGLSTRDVLLIVLVIAMLLVGGWYGYWALARAGVANRYEVNTGTQQYQAALISQERDRVTGWYVAVPTQRQAIADQFCAVYPQLRPPPEDLATAHDAICTERPR